VPPSGLFRASGFGFLSDLGFRVSDFGLSRLQVGAPAEIQFVNRPTASASARNAPLATRRRLPDTAPVQPTLAQLTDRLIESYTKLGGINHVDGKNLPSKQAIAALARDLLCLLFPGFFEEKLQHSSELKANTEKLLGHVRAALEAEIAKALEYNPPAGLVACSPSASKPYHLVLFPRSLEARAQRQRCQR
jgi:hypothetical protein